MQSFECISALVLVCVWFLNSDSIGCEWIFYCLLLLASAIHRWTEEGSHHQRDATLRMILFNFSYHPILIHRMRWSRRVCEWQRIHFIELNIIMDSYEFAWTPRKLWFCVPDTHTVGTNSLWNIHLSSECAYNLDGIEIATTFFWWDEKWWNAYRPANHPHASFLC